MAYTRGRCTNLDYCSIAAARRDIEVRVGDDFVCPECGKPLKAPQATAAPGTNYVLPAMIGGGVLLLIGGGVFLGMRMNNAAPPAAQMARVTQSAPATQTAPAETPTAAPASDNVLIHLAGAAELGSTVVPQLAAAYLAQIGDSDIKSTQGDAPGQIIVAGQRGDRRETIVIDGASAADGFRALSNHTADIVLSPRRILAAERDALTPLGDMTAPTAEHLAGLGAFAVIVNPALPVAGLRRDQISSLLTGATRNWSAVGAPAGPVDVYGLSSTTEQGAAFTALALAGGTWSAGAKQLPDAAGVAKAVAADPHGIGVVDLANIQQNRAVSIADTGATPLSPTDHAAVAHQDYPFAYPVYFYTAPGGAGSIAQRFVEYTMSPAGQALIEQHGLVSQTLKPAVAPAAAPQTAAGSYKQFVTGAKKLAITFHFQANSTDLDLKGTRDLDRVLNYVLSNHFSPDQLLLVGFADNQGDPVTNLAVSKKRADAVAALFVARGLKPGKVAGFGAQLEVADNATEEGREKNRRVEVYIKQ